MARAGRMTEWAPCPWLGLYEVRECKYLKQHRCPDVSEYPMMKDSWCNQQVTEALRMAGKFDMLKKAEHRRMQLTFPFKYKPGR